MVTVTTAEHEPIRPRAPEGLRKALTPKALKGAWKATVRAGLRNQPLMDLHDHLDYHLNMSGICERLAAQVTAGVYRPKSPEVVLSEKALGVCRRTVVPQPEDALVLQALVDYLEPFVKARRPSDAAYYSRSHSFPTIESLDGTFSYPWWLLWPEFQGRIWKFAESRPITVVTDVANYYDTIPLHGLRHELSRLMDSDVSLLDFLFFVLDSFVWRPDYIPHPGMGLPQLDFDTPRLLAHTYLFPADELLESCVPGSWVRWMDDIDFGVDTERDAKDLLRRLDQVLSSYGVRLNTGKTKILTAAEASRYFWIQDNRALGVVRNLIDEGVDKPHLVEARRRLVEKSYRRFNTTLRKSGYVGHWDKVLKRYLDLLGRLRSPLIVRQCGDWMRSRPGVRPSVLRYLQRLGFTRSRFMLVARFLQADCVDDVALFACARLLVTWRVPNSRSMRTEMMALALELGGRSTRASFVPFVAGLLLVVKYGSGAELDAYVERHRACWAHHEWAGRQVAAAAPRLSGPAIQSVRRTLVETAQVEGLRVLDHLDRLASLDRLDKRLTGHLDPEPHKGNPYPFGKVLLLLHFSKSPQLREAVTAIREKAITTVEDRVVASLLNEGGERSPS